MKVSIFTDEISPDPARAITLAAEWRVPYVELRGLAGGRFPRVSDDELHTFHPLVINAGLQVSGVSPGLCKCPVDDPSVEPDLAELLPRACEWALRRSSFLNKMCLLVHTYLNKNKIKFV